MNEDFLSYVLVTNDVGSQIRYISAERPLIFPTSHIWWDIFIWNNLVYMVVESWQVNVNELYDVFENGVHTYKRKCVYTETKFNDICKIFVYHFSDFICAYPVWCHILH